MCETEELAELSQSLMTIGMLFGAIFFPSLSGKMQMLVVIQQTLRKHAYSNI